MRTTIKKDIHKLKSAGIWMIVIAVFISEMLFYTWCRVQCRQAGYEITQQTDRRRKLMILQNNLKIELARLKSPERIELIAKNRLDLVTPSPDQIIIIP